MNTFLKVQPYRFWKHNGRDTSHCNTFYVATPKYPSSPLFANQSVAVDNFCVCPEIQCSRRWLAFPVSRSFTQNCETISFKFLQFSCWQYEMNNEVSKVDSLVTIYLDLSAYSRWLLPAYFHFCVFSHFRTRDTSKTSKINYVKGLFPFKAFENSFLFTVKVHTNNNHDFSIFSTLVCSHQLAFLRTKNSKLIANILYLK